jgi:hypothetical protein
MSDTQPVETTAHTKLTTSRRAPTGTSPQPIRSTLSPPRR